MAGRWMITEQEVYAQGLEAVSSTTNLPLGSIARGRWTAFASGSTDWGAGEFIYLKGVASTAEGLVVLYDPIDGTTTLATAALGGNKGRPVAVAKAASTAGTYGWYQIAGGCRVQTTASVFATNAPVYLSSTGGKLTPTAASGDGLVGMAAINDASVTTTSSYLNVVLNRPSSSPIPQALS